MASRTRGRPVLLRAASCAFAIAVLHACAVAPTPPARERFPVVLDDDRPLLVRRSEKDRYTCGGTIRMVCEGANMTWLMCRCPTIGL